MSNNPAISDLESKTKEQSEASVHHVVIDKTVDNEEVPDDSVTARKKRKLLWKIDLFILPLLVIVYFFGSMVSPPSYECIQDSQILGTYRLSKRKSGWNGRRTQTDRTRLLECCKHVPRWLHCLSTSRNSVSAEVRCTQPIRHVDDFSKIKSSLHW